jgi:putative membrane protein
LKADRFFSSREKEGISQAIKAVEKRTIGEVAVILVEQSDPYPEGEFLGSLLLGGLLAFVLTLAFFHGQIWFLIPLHLLFAFPLYLLLKRMPGLKIPFVGPRRIEEAVRRRALQAFYEKGLYKTRGNTGVLFFLSLLEHKVWILADKGIYEEIKQEKLNQFAGQVSGGLKEGRSVQALVEAIREAGDLLAEHFPVTAGDTDELPDEVQTLPK